MRKIEQAMLAAIKQGKNWSQGNTYVEFNAAKDKCSIFLHSNHIATIIPDNNGGLAVYTDTNTLLYWPTPTTKSRLRALGVNLTTKKGKLFIDGVEVTA